MASMAERASSTGVVRIVMFVELCDSPSIIQVASTAF